MITKRTTPTKAIRLMCLDCPQSSLEVKLCPVTTCPLWTWRFGRRPETIETKNPELVDGPHVRLAGVLKDAYDWESSEDGAWRNPNVRRVMELCIQDREPDMDLIGKIIRRCEPSDR